MIISSCTPAKERVGSIVRNTRWTRLLPTEQRARRIKAPLAFHEAGHAVIGWALGLHVIEITALDDRPGKAKIDGAERLPLVDQIAIYQVGHAAEESLGYLLP